MTTQLLPLVKNKIMKPLRMKVKDGGVSYMSLPGFKQKCTLPYEVQIQANDVEKIIAEKFGYTLDEIRGKGRVSELVACRQVLMYFLRTKSGMKLAEIGKRFNRDHTTVIHSLRTVNGLLETDEQFNNHIKYIESILI